jgi:hypothetical protein
MDWSSPEGRIIVAARKELTEHVADRARTYLADVLSRLVNLWPTPGSTSSSPGTERLRPTTCNAPSEPSRAQAAHQIAPHLLDQCRLLIEETTDCPQQRLKPPTLPKQFQIGKAHLPRRRPRHGTTQQAEKCRPQPSRSAPLLIQRTTSADCSVRRRIISTARSCLSRQKLARTSLCRNL